MALDDGIMIFAPNGVKMVQNEHDYRMELYGKFQTSAVMLLIVEALGRSDNPDGLRETLLETWKGKMLEERREGLEQFKDIIKNMKEKGDDLPPQFSDESIEEQQQFFFGMIEEMMCDLRAMMADPKPGGA